MKTADETAESVLQCHIRHGSGYGYQLAKKGAMIFIQNYGDERVDEATGTLKAEVESLRLELIQMHRKWDGHCCADLDD